MRDDPWLITCVGVRFDLALLPHFLAHYAALGVPPARVVCILNAPDADDPGFAEADAILAAAGCQPGRRWVAPYTSASMWAERRRVQDEVAGPDAWVLSADVDEHHEYPEALPDFLARAETTGTDCVQGVFIDRLAADGRLAPVEPSPALTEQFPVQADAIGALGGVGRTHNRLGTVKIMAMRGAVRPSRGGHHPAERHEANHLYRAPLGEFARIDEPAFRFAVPTRVHHYHWTASLEERLRVRLATPGVSPAGAEYGAKQLAILEKAGGVPMDRIGRAAAPDGPWTERLDALRRQGARINALRPARTLAKRVRERLPV